MPPRNDPALTEGRRRDLIDQQQLVDRPRRPAIEAQAISLQQPPRQLLAPKSGGPPVLTIFMDEGLKRWSEDEDVGKTTGRGRD